MFSAQVGSASFTPKFAVMLLFAAVGVVPLARLAKERSALRWPARAAVAFLAVALVSALVSHSPNIGIFGLYLWGTGWLFWLGVAGAFAIGASLGPADRKWVFGGLLAGVLTNALVAFVQTLGHIQTGVLALFAGRQADGLMGNPIHLEALLLGALALILGRTCRAPRRWGVVVLFLAVTLEFTFERLAVVVLVLLVLYALYSYGVRRGGTYGLLIAAGYVIGLVSRGSGLSSRVASGTAETTFGVRLRVWWASAHYIVHHPLLGSGPGQLRNAMDSTATLSFFQNVLAGKILVDAHDIFVEVGVTTGLLGLACFLVWLFRAASLAERCDFLGFAAALIAVGLVEPMNIAVLPLALLSLGVATGVRMHRGERTDVGVGHGDPAHEGPAGASPMALRVTASPGFIVTLVAVAAALFIGVTMVIGDAYMLRGLNYSSSAPFNLAATKEANTFLPYWPDSALEVAEVEALKSATSSSNRSGSLRQSRDWMVVAVNRDSGNPRLWTLLAGADAELGADRLALSEYHRALVCDRWYTDAYQGLAQFAGARGDWKAAVGWYRLAVLTSVKDQSDVVTLRKLLRGAEEKARVGTR
jgi:hypothetical protein